MLASAHPCVRERKDEKGKRKEKESERGRGNKRSRLIEKKTNKRNAKWGKGRGRRAKLLDGEIHRDNLIRGLRCG